MKAMLIQLLVAVAASAAMLGAYDGLVARPARKLGVVDTLSLFRLEEAQLASLMARDTSTAQRERMAARAHAFAEQFPRELEQIATDCGCVVVERSALIGTPPHLVDLTPELKRRMQL